MKVGTAFLILAGKTRDELQKQIQKLLTTRPPVSQRTWRKPQWLRPELRVKVRHLGLNLIEGHRRVEMAKALAADGLLEPDLPAWIMRYP